MYRAVVSSITGNLWDCFVAKFEVNTSVVSGPMWGKIGDVTLTMAFLLVAGFLAFNPKLNVANPTALLSMLFLTSFVDILGIYYGIVGAVAARLVACK